MPNVPLNVGTFTRSLLLHLARSSGRLDRAGIDVHETLVTSSPAQFESLESGTYDVVFTSPDNVLAYRFLSQNPLGRNLPVQILGAVDRGLGLSLCLGPSIGSADQLRGRVVGVDVPASGFAFVAYALLERAGLHRGDYVVEALGSTPRRASALMAGDCAATVLNAGNELRAQGAGCTIVSTVTEIGPYLGTVIAALESDNPQTNEVRRRFADVVLATAQEIIAGARRDDTVQAAMLLLELTEEEALAHYGRLLDPTTGLIADGKVDRDSINTLITLRRAYAPAPELEDIADALTTVVASYALA
jgi:ABC-type nitrate/sulfonate/bicarbonate transport system substrate-binding protein